MRSTGASVPFRAAPRPLIVPCRRFLEWRVSSMRKTLNVGVATATLFFALAGTALATHTHAMVVGNGQCVVIAEDAGEENVVLPDAVFERNPNVDIAATEGRSHPLHVLVHQGVPGDQLQIYVYGSAQANAACAAGYVNR